MIAQSQVQEIISQGSINGNFQIDAQYYDEDTLIGAPPVPEKVLMNGFANLIYTNGRFSAGLRYESYQNALQGFDPRYQGSGITYRYASYEFDKITITAGNYYEQFGNGLIFRSYEERNLGYDNAMDGFRVKFYPVKGVTLKGIIGRQRVFFDYSPGIVRGVDGEVILNELRPKWSNLKTTVILGGSFISKYQQDIDPVYNLPENVGAWAGRFNVNKGKVSVQGEYAYKINDPYPGAGVYDYNYKDGEAAYLSASYSQRGLAVILAAKRIDNMMFRSDRAQLGNNALINYLPALSKQHTYNLAASLYPYATQPNGEMGIQADVIYNLKKKSLLGGKYGSILSINYSAINNIDTTHLGDMESSRKGYVSDFLTPGDEAYFRDFNVELNRKVSSKIKLIMAYYNVLYNMPVIQGIGSTVHANIAVADVAYRINKKHTIRTELQHLWTKQDQGDWATGVVEYTIAPKWFFSVIDQFNYGNPEDIKQIHYLTGSVGFVDGPTRLAISYGRQRAGIFCVGGVCRNVPASNGVAVSITSSF